MTTTKKLMIATAALFSLGLTSAGALAEGQGKGGRGADGAMMLRSLDANNDGSVSKAEFDASTAKRFTVGDKDGNGNMTKDEFVASLEAMRAERETLRNEARKARLEERSAGRNERRMTRMFDMLDADNDGLISLAELTDHGDDRFARMDDNQDGLIDASEMPSRGGRNGR